MTHATLTFKQEVLPKLELRIKDAARSLRWSMYIAEGDTIEDIAEREQQLLQIMADSSKIDQEKTLKQLKPLNEQLAMMKVNSDKVKALLEKTG